MINFRGVWKSLLVALAISIGAAGLATAQSTEGNIAGSAAEGETIIVKGDNGVNREIRITKTGKFQVRRLPVGNYNVIRVDVGGNVVQTQATEVMVGRTSRLM